MKIKVKDIRPEGIEVSDKIALEIIGLTENDDVRFIAPLEARAKVSRVENTVLAKTHLQGQIASFCSRCLEKVQQGWSGDFVFDVEVNRNTDYVELDEDIRQEVILNLPTRLLCKKDCKGICSTCGTDLNKEQCECKSAQVTKGKTLNTKF